MHFLSHLSYPYLAANGIALAMGRTIPLKYNILLIFFSLIVDIDQIFDFVKQMATKGKYKLPPTHHENFTHWPIIYVPVLVIALITMNPFFLIVSFAIYLHLFMDAFFCNQGVMWLYPFSTKWFNFFSESTKKKPGLKWNEAYGKLRIATFDKAAFGLLLVHITILII